MNHKDFEVDEDRFRKQVGVRRFDVNGATTKLLELIDQWKEVGQQYLDGTVSVTAVPVDSRIDGEVLGKKFSIRYAPFGLEGEGALEAALSIQDLVTGKAIELSRFLVSSTGTILSVEGDELIDLRYRDAPYKALVAVVSRVINAPSKA